MASHRSVMDEIHVLVVDHESQDLDNTTRMLEMCQYRVTSVELASFAIKMLLRGKTKFDVILANINSSDLHGSSLLQHAVIMNIPIILMSIDDNTMTAKRVIEDGAYLYIKKPTTMETLRFLWQHVMREKTRMMKEMDKLMTNNYNAQGIRFEEMVHHHSNMLMMKESNKSKETLEERKEEFNLENDTMVNNKKRKVCIEWTEELHKKFLDAIQELGEGRCFPKDILELMNVPGLTRMQVASHLQKCRSNNWRPHKQRKSNSIIQHAPSDTKGSQQNQRRIVSKPRLGRAPSSHVETRNDGEIKNMKTQAIMINTSHEAHLNNTKPGTNSSDPEPPLGSEQKSKVPSMDAKGKGRIHE